jgi:hypothetical protein
MIRAWAVTNGLEVSAWGRIAQDLTDRCSAAQGS